MDEIYDVLTSVIDYIQKEYNRITDKWLNRVDVSRINLKKTEVRNVDSDGELYNIILNYSKFINEECSSIPFELGELTSQNITARVKAQNSIEYKLENYRTENHESGKVSINKCLNDLYGIRIILEKRTTFSEINDFVTTKYGQKYKCIDSSKGDYKATHIYFKKNNNSFQWELQIWNSDDKESNFESHKKYKQDYTQWEKKSKEGGIISD